MYYSNCPFWPFKVRISTRSPRNRIVTVLGENQSLERRADIGSTMHIIAGDSDEVAGGLL